MASIEAKVCPHCGTRNKPQWEFCAGCGETMADVTVVSAADAHATLTVDTSDPSAIDSDSPGVPWGSVIMLPALVVATFFAFRGYRPEPFQPSPSLFSFATPAPELAGPVPPAPRVNPNLAKGRTLLYNGDAAGALEWLARAASEDSGDAGARYAYAQALWQVGEKDRALDEYATAAQLDPTATGVQLNYARALAGAGRYPQAVTRYESLLRENPDSMVTLRELSTMYIQTGDLAKAVPLLKRAAVAADGDFARMDLAAGLEQAGATAEAEKLYRQVMAERPTSVAARTELSELLARADRGPEALALLREGLVQSPGSAGLHRQLGRLLNVSGHGAEAVPHLREYARLAPKARDAQDAMDLAARLESASSVPSS
jgi:predicted Zn-dependent protease